MMILRRVRLNVAGKAGQATVKTSFNNYGQDFWSHSLTFCHPCLKIHFRLKMTVIIIGINAEYENLRNLSFALGFIPLLACRGQYMYGK